MSKMISTDCGQRRVRLTIEEAWDFYQAISWLWKNVAQGTTEFHKDLNDRLIRDLRDEPSPEWWVADELESGVPLLAVLKSHLMVEGLGCGRTSGFPGKGFIIPSRVAEILGPESGRWQDSRIFGCLKEVYPPVFWYGDC